MKFRQMLSIVAFATCSAVPVASPAQTAAAEPPQSSLIGSWLVTVDGEAATRTLIVTEEAPTGDGALLAAKYGMTAQGPIEAKMIRLGAQRQLVLVTQAGTKIVATEQSDGNFKGTFTLKSGGVKEVTIARMSEEMRQQLAQARAAPVTQEPGPDVPAPRVPPSSAGGLEPGGLADTDSSDFGCSGSNLTARQRSTTSPPPATMFQNHSIRWKFGRASSHFLAATAASASLRFTGATSGDPTPTPLAEETARCSASCNEWVAV